MLKIQFHIEGVFDINCQYIVILLLECIPKFNNSTYITYCVMICI